MTDRAMGGVDDTLAVEMYRRMVRIREFDTLVPLLVKMGRIQGTAHSAVGQEAVAVGTLLRPPADGPHHLDPPRPRPRDRQGRRRRAR